MKAQVKAKHNKGTFRAKLDAKKKPKVSVKKSKK